MGKSGGLSKLQRARRKKAKEAYDRREEIQPSYQHPKGHVRNDSVICDLCPRESSVYVCYREIREHVKEEHIASHGDHLCIHCAKPFPSIPRQMAHQEQCSVRMLLIKERNMPKQLTVIKGPADERNKSHGDVFWYMSSFNETSRRARLFNGASSSPSGVFGEDSCGFYSQSASLH